MRALVVLSLHLILAAVSTAQPQFSPVTHDEAERLEKLIATTPDDFDARASLIGFHTYRGDGFTAEARKLARRKHILWLIRNHPDAEALAQPAAGTWPNEGQFADPDGYKQAVAAWREQLVKPNVAAATLMRAATFFRATPDRDIAFDAVERGIRSFPQEHYFQHLKGALDAFTVAGVRGSTARFDAFDFDPALAASSYATRAHDEMLVSRDPQLLNGAMSVMPQLYSSAQFRNQAAIASTLLTLAENAAAKILQADHANLSAKSTLSMMYSTAAARVVDPSDRAPILEKALANAVTENQKFFVLDDLARARLALGDTAKAAELAKTVLAMAERMPNDWNYGNAIHHGNLVLGQIALANGNLDEAKGRLLAAGRTKGSPQLNSFGPSWELAQDLLNHGERTAVLNYIALVRAFWKNHDANLDSWDAAIRAGAVPRLGRIDYNQPRREQNRRTLVGSAAPKFRLRTLDGTETSLESYKGRAVLLDFWATWCGPCREEMPSLERLHKEWSGRDVVVLAVDVDEPKETVQRFVREHKYTLPVLLTEGTSTPKDYGIDAYPTLVAVDKSGRIADVIIGGRPEPELRRIADAAKAGAPAAPAAPAVANVEQTADDWLRTGIGHARAKKFVEADEAFTHAIEMHKDWLQAYRARAQARYAMKRFDEAISDFDEIVRLTPNDALAYDRRGLAYSYSGRHERALANYTKAIELAPENPNPYNNRGWAYLELGRLDQALADLNHALELNPAHQLALENRLRLYMQTRRYTEAIKDGEAVLRINPDAAWAKERIAEARRASGTASASLAGPQLLSPADRSVFSHYPRDTVLKWAALPGAISYELQIDYQSDGKWSSETNGVAPVLRTNQTEYRFPFVGAQPGRWRVRALGIADEPGQWTEWRHFRYTR